MKIAVFTTSDIQVPWKWDGYTFITEIEGTEIYSTGALEYALKEGYTVYVMTSRREFGIHDEWWMSKVNSIRNGYYKGGGASDLGSIEAWKALYRQLNLPYQEYDTWMKYYDSLPEFGIQTGNVIQKIQNK